MPKKSGPRPIASSGPDQRARRTARQVPRPSATVPVGAEVTVRPVGERVEAAGSVTPRQPTSATSSAAWRSPASAVRGVRPSRASTLPAINDYSYVYADLRRIGMLAGAAFLVLVGLTFVVH